MKLKAILIAALSAAIYATHAPAQLSESIWGKSALGAAPATDDLLVLYDTSASATKTMTVANLFATPTFTTPAITGTITQTSTSATAFVSGANGGTNPGFVIDNSTASVATGIKVKGAAAAGGAAISVISSGTNEALTIDAKGSGTITLGGTSTGAITLTRATTLSAAATLSSTLTQTSTSATALVSGANGGTNPGFVVDNSTSSVATGIKIKGAAATAGVAISAISSGTDESLTLDAKGSGLVTIGGTSTGGVFVTKRLGTDYTEVVTATNMITAAESGSVFFLSSATEFVSTLPAPAAGLHFTFIVTAAPSGASYTIVTNSSSNIIVGEAVNAAGAAGDTGTTDDTVSFVDGQSVVGDKVEFWSDGTKWYCHGTSAVAAGITFTTAS